MQSHSLPSFPKPFASSSSFTSRSNTHFTLQSSSFATSLISSSIFPPPRCNRIQIGGNIFRGTSGFARAYRAALSKLHNSDYSVAENSDCECHLATPIVSSDADNNRSIELVKFMLFFAFLTLQDSYPAAAASDFASGLNSIPIFGDVGDLSTGFASAFLLIFFSELGDKTFFIAALLAARNSAGVVFLGTFGALAAMTVISVGLGRTFHYVDELLPFRCTLGSLPCWMPHLVIAKNQMMNRRSPCSSFFAPGSHRWITSRSWCCNFASRSWWLFTRDIFVREGYFLYRRCSLSRLCCSNLI
ncbi:uncharacterized protein [Cicer arietinum]|uniref:uncharacterized protein isoform X2 n=1 Tax=Cicer arietinum TaxID=3827 RepID=UPI003CC528F5